MIQPQAIFNFIPVAFGLYVIIHNPDVYMCIYLDAFSSNELENGNVNGRDLVVCI